MDPTIPKLPGECTSLGEIRAEIDRIDRSIVESVAQRKRYVVAAARFKTNLRDVAAPERFAAMLQERREWAERQGVGPDLIEEMFRAMVTHFIAEERAHWEARSGA
jgi:isochorismate pyruvate lyase